MTQAEAANELINLIGEIVVALVDDGSKVRVDYVGGGDSLIVLEVGVARADVGHVIGKGGRNVDAMRQLLMSAATKLGVKASLQVLE